MADKRIYIAEDDPIQQKITRAVLASYETLFFADGLELYRKAVDDPPDLMVLDIILPSLTGLAISRLIKFDEDCRKIPVMIVSSIVENDIEEQVRDVGADAFLPKPLDMDRFTEEIERLLAAE